MVCPLYRSVHRAGRGIQGGPCRAFRISGCTYDFGYIYPVVPVLQEMQGGCQGKGVSEPQIIQAGGRDKAFSL